MEVSGQFSASKKRKARLGPKTMSSVNCGFVLILLSILMTLINGKPYDDKFRSRFGLSKYSSSLAHYNPRRHSQHYSGKHKYLSSYYDLPRFMKMDYDYKKSRRFSALDKVDDRLDSAAVSFYDKSRKITTSNPIDLWGDWTTPNFTLLTSGYVNGHVAFKGESDKTATNHVGHKHHKIHGKDKFHGFDKDLYGDFEIDLSADSRGYLQDFTTSKPSESTRQDTTYPDGLGITTKNATTTEGLAEKAKTQPWTDPQPPPENLEEKLKTTTPKVTDPRDAAIQHLNHMYREGRCRTPKAKVIRVQEVHPDSSKHYSPSCTILHRCGADTGCCENLKHVCKPKNITKVELYFLTSSMGQPHKVEKLHFENHTECACRSKAEDLMPRDSADVISYSKNKIFTARLTKSNCTCPKHYSPRYLYSGLCICDCFDKDTYCLHLKKGKETFESNDQMCIKQGICSHPSCEFGVYSKISGRCPKKHEKNHFSRRRKYMSRERIT